MFYINDLVRVTERAKKDTYDNAWWTDKDLLVESMESSEDLKEDNQYIYSFTTVDGEEVPCSLYDYELELVKSIYPVEIRERLNHKYEFVNYSVECIIDEERELEFLEEVFNSITKDEFDIDSLITNSIDKVNPCSLEDSLSYYGYELEDYIDEYMKEKRPKTLCEAMNGGIYNYLQDQYFKNKVKIYKNLLYLVLNNKIKYIYMSSNEDVLSSDSCVFIQFDIDEVIDLIDEFIYKNLGILDTKEVPEIYSMFCNFLKTKK